MTIRKTSRVTLTVRGFDNEDIRDQVREYFGLVEPGYSEPEVSNPGEIKTSKLSLVKMLREFEKRFYPQPEGVAHPTGLIQLKTFVEEYFHIC